MLLPIAAIIVGLILLVWSADRFVDGSAATARYFGMPSLLIGIIIVGFGTSAPEMVVSALAATAGNPGIALGNAYGSNITNIGLILGFTALISPIAVSRQVVVKELPILLAISALALWQIFDGYLSRIDAFILLGVFALIMGTTIYQSLRNKNQPTVSSSTLSDHNNISDSTLSDSNLKDNSQSNESKLNEASLQETQAHTLAKEEQPEQAKVAQSANSDLANQEITDDKNQNLEKSGKDHPNNDVNEPANTQDIEEQSTTKDMSLPKALMWLVVGLVLLIVSSRMLVWGAVAIAQALGISDLIIGLTIVAVGTSLPELASSIIAAIKNEHDIALGNIIGSNLFNTLAVVGIAGSIAPMPVTSEVMTRDMSVMCALTIALLLFALGKKGKARINRFEGSLLLLGYIAYTVYLVSTAFFAVSH